MSLGFSLGQQGISFWGIVSVLILFSYFAGNRVLFWVIPVVLIAVLVFLIVLVKKLKCDKGNCLIIVHEICFPELDKACTRAIPGFCVVLQGTCLNSTSLSMRFEFRKSCKIKSSFVGK